MILCPGMDATGHMARFGFKPAFLSGRASSAVAVQANAPREVIDSLAREAGESGPEGRNTMCA